MALGGSPGAAIAAVSPDQLSGHTESREGNWMGEWKISNTFSFKEDQMTKGKEIGFIKIALIYLGKISKRNMRLAP